jgi:predicted AlkP superfamily phosphohydrolase/phosphomutase
VTRTFVVGLDGASWLLLEPWIEDGELPNLAAIRESGVWSESRSCLPPVTFPNWKCYSASKNPGALGVFWFEHVDMGRGEIRVASGGDFETAEIWDYLNDAGHRTAVVNMPTMYPPREIDGYVICGGPDAVDGEYRSIDSGYTSPPSLEDRLEREYDYRVHPDPLLSSNRERGAEVDAIIDLLDLRFQVAFDMLEEEDVDFVHVTLFYLNVLQHFFWRDEPTERAWRLVDEWIGRLADLEDTNLVVMSDHGSAATEVEFFVNQWLAENGYLAKRRSIEDLFQRVGVTRETALAAAKRLGIVDLLASVVPESIQKRVPQAAGAKRERKMEMIVLPRTRALASGQGPVYLNPAFERESVREELVRDLTEVTDDEGKPLFEGVHPAEDVYEGPYVDEGPEVVIDQRAGVTINDGLGGNDVLSEPTRWAAENARHGIFVAAGPDFEPAGDLGATDIRDIAPTVLAAMGVDVPTDMEGTVLPVVPDGPPGEREPLAVGRRASGREEEVADRLKQLGYME